MIMPRAQIKEVLLAGGSLVLDGSAWTMSDLSEFAAAAAKANVRLTIKNVGSITHDHLRELASLAPGLVVFDLS